MSAAPHTHTHTHTSTHKHLIGSCVPVCVLQVVQQLRCVEANMAHCKLGRRGAQALRYALATNNTITSLDLSDNALDAQV